MAGAGSASLLRLLHLVSPALPIGAFHFSQGLEYAVEAGWVRDEATAADWIGGLAAHSFASLDLPVLLRLHSAWAADDRSAVCRWSQRLLAGRETAELRAEDRHLGAALARILSDLGIRLADPWLHHPDTSYAALFALAAVHWKIPSADAAYGYLWTLCENQILAAVKLVPLGQRAGQRLLNTIITAIPALVEKSMVTDEDHIGASTPAQGIASARHENQYSRLFRS